MEDITALLARAQAGDSAAENQLAEQVYQHLQRLARYQRRGRAASDTLNTTALVHEAWIKLLKPDSSSFENRVHFFAVAAKALRQILINHAEKQRALRRGGDAKPVELSEALWVTSEQQAETILSVAQALEKIRRRDESLAQIVEYRFFVGLTFHEIAELLELSEKTIKRRWQRAKAWLSVSLDEAPERAP